MLDQVAALRWVQRQHRGVRRRPEQRDDLRRVGRRHTRRARCSARRPRRACSIARSRRAARRSRSQTREAAAKARSDAAEARHRTPDIERCGMCRRETHRQGAGHGHTRAAGLGRGFAPIVDGDASRCRRARRSRASKLERAVGDRHQPRRDEPVHDAAAQRARKAARRRARDRPTGA